MICPKCANDKTEVVATIKGLQNRRWRKCPECGYSFSSVEAVEADPYWKEYAREALQIESKSKAKQREFDL